MHTALRVLGGIGIIYGGFYLFVGGIAVWGMMTTIEDQLPEHSGLLRAHAALVEKGRKFIYWRLAFAVPNIRKILLWAPLNLLGGLYLFFRH